MRLVRQLSGSRPCVANANWIWGGDGIYVWDGCRAEFEHTVR